MTIISHEFDFYMVNNFYFFFMSLDAMFIPPPPPLMNAAPPPPPPPQIELTKTNKSVEAVPDTRSALLEAIRSGKTLKVCTMQFNLKLNIV